MIVIIVASTITSSSIATPLQSASSEGFVDLEGDLGTGFIDLSSDLAEPKAPMAVSPDGNNVYIVWWTNKSDNWEVMFRASTDDGGGQTFGDKINLSNSSDTESQNAEMVAAGDSVCLFHSGKPVQKLGQVNLC